MYCQGTIAIVMKLYLYDRNSYPILFGGDQVTASHAKFAKLTKVNSCDPYKDLIDFREAMEREY